MPKKIKTTYEEFMETLSPTEKKEYKKGYRELLISEMLLAMMESDNVSVRKLAKAAGVSPAIVQGIRSGSNQNITIKSLMKILNALGCSLIIEKDGNKFSIELPRA